MKTAAAILILLIPAIARADFQDELSNASRPISDGVPEVSIARLQRLLDKDLPAGQRRLVADKMSEALIAAQQPAEAIALLQKQPPPENLAEKFLRAQALAALARWNEALPLYQTVAADRSSGLRTEAIFGAAEALRALGRTDAALQNFALLLPDRKWSTRAVLRMAELFLGKSDVRSAQRVLGRIGDETITQRKLRRFLRGRIELAENRPDRALANLEPLVRKPEGVSHPLVVASLFGIADAHLQLKTPESGDDFLEDFIEHHPGDPVLPDLFRKLDALYRAERKPVRVELERWTREPEQPRRGFAQWYLARIELRAGHPDRAVQLLAALRGSNANDRELAGGLFELAKLQMQAGEFAEAIVTLEKAHSWQPATPLVPQIDFLAAQAHYAAGEFRPAAVAFQQLVQSAPAFSSPALYNASLGWLQLGESAAFAADYAQLQKRSNQSAAELRLEEGLLQAKEGRPEAAETLEKFTTDFPGDPRVSEAWVALAELAFHANPPRLEKARKFLTLADESHATAAARERAAYLKIWIEDAAAANGEAVIQLAGQFLQRYPDSRFAPDVRMKLAEAYYLRQDFANAQTQFELFAQHHPDSLLTEKALFFAAESAMSSMAPHAMDRAIVLFDQVAQLKGDLRWAARNEEATIERKLGRPREALLLYDEVLKNDAGRSEKREALCGKGDVFFELSAGDPQNYDRAIAAYDELAAETNEPGHWHNQALFKKGVCLEKKSDSAAALATFYQVIEAPAGTSVSPEFFWFYKSGFNAARLLESESRWDSAARVYEKLVAAGGMRSEEAKLRLNRLRLEHFLFEE